MKSEEFRQSLAEEIFHLPLRAVKSEEFRQGVEDCMEGKFCNLGVSTDYIKGYAYQYETEQRWSAEYNIEVIYG